MFDDIINDWFFQTFNQPTDVQLKSWDAISSGDDVLISAPTGSGKTLAAFLYVINSIYTRLINGADQSLTVIYVSPLKALSHDIQVNLKQPLSAIEKTVNNSKFSIRAELWTGDTPSHQRSRIKRDPPHILVTTPESLYNLLTSSAGRSIMCHVNTLIIDEVHALAPHKRGAHLLLSIKRLEAIALNRPQRIAISATQRPIESMRDFILQPKYSQIVDFGHVKQLDISLQLPNSPLQAITSAEQWLEIYDSLQQHIEQHATTLIFVNNRRLAERMARFLGERIGSDHVGAHHGSLARKHRLAVEKRLKNGNLKALVATSSLELGIDVGDIDLVCQMASPGSIHAFLQRVGRAGHGVGKLSKGFLYPLTIDDLVESTALIQAVNDCRLERTVFCHQPLDVLAQQIVAEVAMRNWSIEALYRLFSDNYCYRLLSFDQFESVINMLAQGYSGSAVPQKALIFYNRVEKTLISKKSTQLTALLNGGTIPDHFDYDVELLPSGIKIGSVNEDFSFESLPGDIFQLGNHSYRIIKIKVGTVYVEDAKGMPPNMPFWFGMPMSRSDLLSELVSDVRLRFEQAVVDQSSSEQLSSVLNVPLSAANQLLNYATKTRAALGVFPSQSCIVFERFFDGAEDMHLVIHSVYGARINRAWGLALRKRFCRKFNFELQAAALEDAIILSLGATHSFNLNEVVSYISADVIRELLLQALLDTPFFVTQWRWNASIALAIKRRYTDKRVLPQFQRSAAEDLIAQVFPDQIACAENIQGDRQIPDHPLIMQTLHDCMHDIMDVEGLRALLTDIAKDNIKVHCVDSNTPSPASLSIIHARNYAFLDDAPAEERRTQALKTQKIDSEFSSGLLTSDVIARVNREAMPPIRNADELFEIIDYIGLLRADEAHGMWGFLSELLHKEYVVKLELEKADFYCVVDKQNKVNNLSQPENLSFLESIINNRLSVGGRLTFTEIHGFFPISATQLLQVLRKLENKGEVFQMDPDVWITRSNLSKLRKYSLNQQRRYAKILSVRQWQSFLSEWQFIKQPLSGVQGLAKVLSQLQGYVAPAIEWEEKILPERLSDYRPEYLDQLCMGGQFLWKAARVCQKPALRNKVDSLRRMPLTFLSVDNKNLFPPCDYSGLGVYSVNTLELIREKGALFARDILTSLDCPVSYLEQALMQLAYHGLITIDGFAAVRNLMKKPAERHRQLKKAKKYARNLGYLEMMGRCSIIDCVAVEENQYIWLLMKRYGLLSYDVFSHEKNFPFSWSRVAYHLNILEARGEIIAGRFIDGHAGMQYALPSANKKLTDFVADY